MAQIPSVMKLHLRYRLLIAEMNLDINILRIFEDYLNELESKKREPEVRIGLEKFQKEFAASREEIDQLRHEMHIIKMKLAALARDNKTLDQKTYVSDNHKVLFDRYKAHRRHFESLKKEFSQFEGEWLK